MNIITINAIAKTAVIIGHNVSIYNLLFALNENGFMLGIPYYIKAQACRKITYFNKKAAIHAYDTAA
jgi:hypothetical protein